MSNKPEVSDDGMDHASDADEQGDKANKLQDILRAPTYMMSSVMKQQLLQEHLKLVPPAVKKRINALMGLQLEQLKLEAKFYEEVYELERKYHQLYQPLHDKRKTIISGEYEPTEKESEWKWKDVEEEMSEKMKAISVDLKESLKTKYSEDTKGIPDFWLTIFQTSELLFPLIQDVDEPLFKKLIDIKIVYAPDGMSYKLEFQFEPNEYFTNTVLTKEYFLKSAVDMEYPFTFEGPEIYKCKGCVINWNKGMNLSVKTIKKKQKHKSIGAYRTITKQIPADTFFNFFNPPEVQEEDKDDIDTQTLLASDYEIGHFLRARVVPKAALYFTGEINDDDDEDDIEEEEEEDEEDYDEDESDEDDEDEDGPPPAANPKQTHVGKKKHALHQAQQQAPDDCKTQ